ncbi:hypothetical protein G5C60_34145 [Streptomyces sp. HC44]|uniref:Uncharacterized protein n=1 Tax=Streptomyces scabichelini TaxID=2711217 RepID=A0A6G4VEF5_9ACTN|nr:hypothetical protein [Streptomyces scabichelini]NGO12518.1 hypothetical protein [Streptomyces scabichelini]
MGRSRELAGATSHDGPAVAAQVVPHFPRSATPLPLPHVLDLAARLHAVLRRAEELQRDPQ